MECLTVKINASFMLKLFCTGLEAKIFLRQYGRVIVNRKGKTYMFTHTAINAFDSKVISCFFIC